MGMVYFKLAARSLRCDRARFLPAVCGVAAAVGLLAWHVGLAVTAMHSGDEAAARAASPFSFWITGPAEGRGRPTEAGESPRPEKRPGVRVEASAEATAGRRFPTRATPIPEAALEALRGIGGVERVVVLEMVPVTLDVREGGRVLQGPPLRGNAALLPAGGLPFDSANLSGRLPDMDSGRPEVVVARGMFDRRVHAPEIGAKLAIVLAGGTVEATVSGYFDKTGMVQIFPAIYANGAAMAQIRAKSPGVPARANLALFTGGRAGSILDALSALPPESGMVRLYSVFALAERFRGDTANNLISSLPMTLALALLTSACLVAMSLLIGLALRRRQVAELRCAGMTAGGVARLFAWEALAVVLSGWVAGTVLSAALLQLFLRLEGGGELPASLHVSWHAPAAGLALALAAGGIAVAVPVRLACRVRPLEVLGGAAVAVRTPSRRRFTLALALLLPMALISVCPWLGDMWKGAAMGLVGMPCFAVSLLLMLHPLMWFADKVFAAPLARALGLPPALLRSRTGREPARVAGMILALALGLGGFIAVHVWGGTLMASFVPNPEWPDAIVSLLPNGLDDAGVGRIAGCAGVEGGRVVKIDCTQKPFDASSPAFAGREDELPRGVVLLFGADPDAAFGGERPFADFRFVAGDRGEAVAKMRDGTGCVAVAMLARLAGLELGDRVSFAGRELEIAGIVDLNWHMVTSRSQVRTQFGREAGRRGGGDAPPARTIGAVFVSEKFVRGITGNDRTYFVWLGMTPELDALGGLQATVRLDAEIRAAVGDGGGNAIQVHHRDEIADGTLSHGNDILGVMARIPFWSLAVASTGMVALLLVSARSGLREFKTMRAVGLTRHGLARLLLGEAALAVFAALLLGLVAGIAAGWSFTGLSRWMAMAGLPVRLIVPWGTIARGMAFALALCALMSLAPLGRIVRLVEETR